MKKFIVLIIFYILVSNIIFCQEATISYIRKYGCEKLDPADIGSFRELHLIDYIINHILVHKKDTIFISNRAVLKPIKHEHRSNDTILFKTQDFTLEITKKTLPLVQLGSIESDTFDVNKEKFIAIYSINHKKVYGISESKDTVSILSNICITKLENKYYLPDFVINDLLFPNFHNIAYPIQPLKFYEDPQNEGYNYLYLFGQNKLSRTDGLDVRDFHTYMAKFIFFKGKFIERILVPWRVLNAYDYYCDKFIGF